MIDLEKDKYSIRELYEAGVLTPSVILHFERKRTFNEYVLQDFGYKECIEKTAEKFRCSHRTVERSLKYVKSVSVTLAS